jgi:hypothetical protein
MDMTSTVESPVDGERAAQYLAEIAEPRICGTDMERRTADRIEEHFRSLGLHVDREVFEFGSMGRWITKALVALLPASLFLCLFFLKGFSLLSFLWALAILFLFSYLTRNSSKISRLGHNMGKKSESQNIIATKESTQEERAHLILGAHYDSISTTRSIYPNPYMMERLFMPIFYVSLGLLALIGIVGLISAFTGFTLSAAVAKVFFWLAVIISLLFVTYLITGRGNDSAGASDNASGVAVLMETAHAMTALSFENLRVSFMAFGAEEVGLIGSNHHFFSHRDQLLANKTFVISIDMPAARGKFGYNEKYGIPPCKTDPYLNALVKKAADRIGMECETIGLAPGSGSDHMPFLQRGVPGTLVGAISKESMKKIHTAADDLDAVDFDRLTNACRLIHCLVLEMEESLKG